MKLSLTAIAALFAAAPHSSLAAGTRAASSNGNTNAAEDKPGRDLFLDIDGDGDVDLVDKVALKFGALADFTEELTNGDFAREAAEAGAVAKVVKAALMAESVLAIFGSSQHCGQAISADAFILLVTGQGANTELDNLDDNADNWVCSEELTQAFIMLKSEELVELSQVISASMSVLGHGHGYGRN